MKFKKKALPLTTAILACSLVSTPLLAHSDKAQENFMLLEQEKASNTVYKAYFPSLDIARKAAISFHGQMLESHYDDGYLIMELTDEEMDKLKPEARVSSMAFFDAYEENTPFGLKAAEFEQLFEQLYEGRRAVVKRGETVGV